MLLWVEAALFIPLADMLITYAAGTIIARDQPPLPAKGGARIFWLLREWIYQLAYVIIALFVMPFDALFKKNRRDAARPLIVIVHGFFSTPAHWLPLAFRLRRAGIVNVIRPRYQGAGSLEDCGVRLAKELRDHKGGIVFIGHSFGGLAAVYAASLLPPGKVRKIIALGAPFGGTVMSYFSPTPAGRRLIPGNEFLSTTRDLAANLKIPFACFWSRFDQLVVPAESALLPWAENIEIEGLGHTGYLFSRDVADRVAALVKTEIVHLKNERSSLSS